MESGVYEIEAENEATHWWFVGRRLLFAREIKGFRLPSEARILDIGTSTGTNLRLLRDRGYVDVVGVDSNQAAISYCAEKGLGNVRLTDVCAMPFETESFDLILATDIIEHVEDDGAALSEIKRVLRPGGRVLLTVPAFPALWGLQDEVSRHKRRYRQAPLLRLLQAHGFEVVHSYHFNFILFAPVFLARRIIALLRLDLQSEGQVNTRFLNVVLGHVFALDVWLAPILRPPFGVSLLVICRKPA